MPWLRKAYPAGPCGKNNRTGIDKVIELNFFIIASVTTPIIERADL
jgi:hypothetical protein